MDLLLEISNNPKALKHADTVLYAIEDCLLEKLIEAKVNEIVLLNSYKPGVPFVGHRQTV